VDQQLSDVLVLNADAQPVSFLPLSVVQWKEAVMYMYHDKCTVLDWYDDWVVRSTNWETRVPAVIMLKSFMHKTRNPRFSKTNLYLRDMYECGYCGKRHPKNDLTMDHVMPISKGGKTNWTNTMTACKPCNWRKSDKVGPDWRPLYKPYAPGYYELVRKRKQLDFTVRHPSWYQWLDLEDT